MKDYTIAVLGCGVMGTAVTSAILSTSFDEYPSKIICCNSSEKSSNALKAKLTHPIVEYSFGAESNKNAVEQADVIVLGCKPYMYKDVYEQVKGGLSGDQLLISLLAGITIEELQVFSPYVAKVMTNTPAQFGCGMATIAFSSEAEPKYEQLVMKLISPVGKAIKIPEKNMDAATALVGSAPAFCLLMMEALIDGGVRMGIPYDTARQCAAKVMEGTGKMVDQTGDHPAVLKSKVCTPGGTTIGGLLKLEDAGVRGAIARAIEEAANISKSFSKK
ncbi:delta 1-pyrroline-5-carboxylate reductase [Yamadazyma tenuis]|uniref:Pyrroline-5-carboxylate reductase n=1 Tax=Candida tenuis (strain ATCC 10573 / BCRC 21748 / CBS 615 / JCM 9827 / NBRC 10315 / NRRL Y-1498 / VKM Y-70) TaxID=590646 RepID=G3BCT6_CANTC|nr:pyrroline-5-carboxylate reductase [Yamadazyma tenuis ATCC 10573]EGV60881.1 pyrroline-5-carboxylate reductase [Yamadazyma tenuis ATCC 10573]WEJ93851.1 delta 1-pyrroline-5-carboxylate reductase [Yamadazyma tenuis]